MGWFGSPGSFAFLMLLGFWVLFFSFYDVIFDKGWIYPILAVYVILVILAVVFIILKSIKPASVDTVEEFEKTLGGKLYHFKCPNCNGFFALKKSKHNDKKPFKMTCPDCGEIAVVPPSPICIEEEIPEKKSVNVDFRCKSCGEGITVWAEGAELYPDVCMFSCPYCGMEETMNRI